MSFDQRFDFRWSQVIAPAIHCVEINGKRLEPFRVDARRISDSILTEILSGITRSRLVFGDVTTYGYTNDHPVRNGNVMYEIGIAHAVRLPEEVLLFRSDNDPLLFDMANIRVNPYAPDEEPEKAKSLISDSIIDTLKTLELLRHSTVRKVAESLDFPSYWLLAEVQSGRRITDPEMRTIAQAVMSTSRTNAIRRLLEVGAIRTSYLALTPEKFAELKDQSNVSLLSYECTEFGALVFQECLRQMGVLSPDMIAILENEFQEKNTDPLLG